MRDIFIIKSIFEFQKKCRIQKIFLSSVAFFICSSLFHSVFALQEGKLHPKTASIDAMLYGVDIDISIYEGDSISYKAEIEGNKKVSIVEDSRCVRFRNSHPVSGKITVLVPKDMKMESLRIYSSSANAKLEGVSSAYFVVSMCEGAVNVENAIFKCASFSIASSTFNLSGELTTTADFCFSETKSNINLKGKFTDYNFFYPYEETSILTIEDREVTKKDIFGIDKKKRKRIGITQSSSKTFLTFVQ